MIRQKDASEVAKATLAFDQVEDRIRLTCALKNEERVVLWLTARLARRLAPHLLQLTAKLPAARNRATCSGQADKDSVLQGDTEGADCSDLNKTLTSDAPVVAEFGTPSRLINSIDISNGPMMAQLCFRDTQGHSPLSLSLEHTRLAAWADGLRQCFIQAGWPTECWQEPVSRDSESAPAQRIAVH